MPYRAASLLVPVNELPHLTVLMNDPCADSKCLMVNVTSIKPGRFYDKACVLTVGDHSFIKQPSYMLYRMAECCPSVRIGRLVDLNYYIKRDDVDPAVFARISAGIYASDETPLRIVQYAKANTI